MNNNKLKNQNSYISTTLELIGRSEPFLQVIESIKQVAPTNITILITGESGTGKEKIAQAIHFLSQRKTKPIITVNCGAIPEGILESELFGHEKGSFTGADKTRNGYFEAADQGTIFLDEIGELPIATQVKLLRVLEQKEFMKVGGTQTVKVDVRVVAATNKNLIMEVKKGNFRKDLFYRLNAIKINIPPLRERTEDIILFSNFFAEKVCAENNIKFKKFTKAAIEILNRYPWPGNIRELKNIIERVIILSGSKKIDAEDIESHLTAWEQSERDTNLPVITHKTPEQAERELIYRALLDLKLSVEEIRSYLLGTQTGHKSFSDFSAPIITEIMEENEKKLDEDKILSIHELEKLQIQKALRYTKGNKKKASKLLKIGERTLYRKIKEYDLDNP